MSPRDERVLTLDKNPEALFKAWQKAGKIPAEFESFAQMEEVYNKVLELGVPEAKAREQLGVTYKNVDDQPILKKNTASDGSTRGLNKRAIRTDFNIGAENHLRNRGGDSAVVNRQNEIRTDWNKLSKLEAQQLGIETGKLFHRGHVQAGLEGGSLGNENMWPEHGMRNVFHGKDPRIPLHTMDELGIPKDDLFTIYERQLQAEGLGMPRINNALMIAADEYMVQPKSRDNGYMANLKPKNPYAPYAKPGDGNHNKGAGVNPDRLYALQDKLNQLEAQGISRQTIENWSRNKSGTLSSGNATKQSGPVRQVVAPRKQVVKVVKPGIKVAEKRLVSTGSSPSLSKKPSAPNRKSLKSTRRAPAASKPTAKPVNRTPSPLEQVRRLINSTPDALKIHPGMSLPSVNLIQGI
jgi:hypothetical protein